MLFLVASHVAAEPVWLDAIADTNTRSRIQSLEASADVTVSDGMKYKTQSSWQSSDYAIFNLHYPDSTTTLGKEGLYYWSANGSAQRDDSEALRDFIFGHQFHAEILFIKDFVKSISDEKRQSVECECLLFEAIDLDGNQVDYHVNK